MQFLFNFLFIIFILFLYSLEEAGLKYFYDKKHKILRSKTFPRILTTLFGQLPHYFSLKMLKSDPNWMSKAFGENHTSRIFTITETRYPGMPDKARHSW